MRINLSNSVALPAAVVALVLTAGGLGAQVTDSASTARTVAPGIGIGAYVRLTLTGHKPRLALVVDRNGDTLRVRWEPGDPWADPRKPPRIESVPLAGVAKIEASLNQNRAKIKDRNGAALGAVAGLGMSAVIDQGVLAVLRVPAGAIFGWMVDKSRSDTREQWVEVYRSS